MQAFRRIPKKIRECFLFFFILCLLFMLLSEGVIAVSAKNEKLVQGRNKNIVRIQKEPENTIDVLVIGDSLSYTSVSPMQLYRNHGFTSYVCGQSGQKIQETYYMLKTAMQTQSPKLVVLETNTMFRVTGGVGGLRNAIEAWGNYYFQAFRYHDVWKSLLFNKQYPEESFKGFTFQCAIKPYEYENYMKKTEEAEKITEPVIRYMDKIMALCKEKNATLILVSTPSPSNYNYRIHNALSAYADGHLLDYLDLNLLTKELGINWSTDSLDRGDHLNLSGAQKVTAYLGNYLTSRYRLPDHRGTRAYLTWDTLADVYAEKLQELQAGMVKQTGTAG